MSDPNAGRPRQVTLAGWMLMAGSALAVLLVADRLSALHSLESRQAVEQFLSREPGSGLGLDVDGALSLIRTAAMVTAGCATAAGILGYQVLRRSRSARLAVTVLAVPIFLAGMVTGGFVTSVIAASAAILWLQPARAWFDGTTPPERPAAVAAPTPGGASPASPAASVPAAPGAAAYPRDERRPGAVLWACVLTWVATGVTLFGLAGSGVVLAVRTDVMLDEAHRQSPDLAAQGVTDQMLVVATYLLIGGIGLWCLAAAGIALFVLRGAAWARIVLLVSAAAASAACLVGAAVGAVVLLLPLGASVATIALLLRSEVGLWFNRPPLRR
ncbi:hypothetical protein GON03_10190 [Nocardioides sp. MAH-18]|uniref:Uncharacterized protein n=1 Tax=Nocardioides agri TaxID=2682843 RepID=A0A6L6XQI0_9ACTN|nr:MULTISPECIES: hypothetical protein [unclassified Nocardioides]MBA2954693.1 hypothetical protein [Nocardioides sp. CGMCC 1.13656]MVQ49549.1 hypothetical protein [Nocardioides sp. MAH-18]